MARTLTTRGADIAHARAAAGRCGLCAEARRLGDRRRQFPARTARQGERAGAAAATTRFSRARRPSRSARPRSCAPLLLAIGSSTGGPQALFTLVQGLGAAITGAGRPHPAHARDLHADPGRASHALGAHALRRGAATARPCCPAGSSLAPGDRHLLVEGRRAARCGARLSGEPPENFCRPSVDPMLRSASRGLRRPGADGDADRHGSRRTGRQPRSVIAAGGTAVAQDEATSVVWGMPGAVAQAGLCHRVLPLPRDRAESCSALVRRMSRT